MRDLMRNYRNLLKRKNESDSESETQPLSSSSSSCSKSFGSFEGSCQFMTESEGELPKHKGPVSPITLQRHLQKQFIFPPRFQEENLTDSFKTYAIGKLSDDELIPVKKDGDVEKFKEYEEKVLGMKTQSSLITIFAIWNTTMGSSLLAISWGIEKTGLFPGILINIILAGICLYTAYLLLDVNQKHGLIGQNIEVCDLCKVLLGRWAEILAKVFSLVVLIGANVVYWILMSNFLYNSVHFLYDFLTAEEDTSNQTKTVLCPKEQLLMNSSSPIVTESVHEVFNNVWNLYSTVPLFLALFMFPLLNFKSATFFTKFNSLGTLSVLYVLVFVAIKAYNWGLNIPDWSFELHIKPTFCALTGMLSLSYFIHNIIISIMRSNENQENNGRDLTIAFSLITFTYLFIGVLFYITFPLAKSCIEDNILNNFNKNDALTIVARILLLFQLFTVFPLISFMLRNDILANLNMIFKVAKLGDFTYGRVIFLNGVVLFICVMFACFLPRIGTLIRYTGAFSGLVYIFMLPSLLKMASLRKEGRLSSVKVVLYVTIILIGVLNLISQFFISDK